MARYQTRETAPHDRLRYLDVLRGFALFGVLLANLVSQARNIGIDPSVASAFPTADLDEIAIGLVRYFVAAKAYTLFAILFGAGFTLQLDRLEARGLHGEDLLGRRLLALWLFGLAHAVFLWHGDVLVLYATAGFGLLAFRRLAPRWQLVLGLALSILPSGVFLPLYHILFEPSYAGMSAIEIEGQRQAFAEGTYLDIVRENVGAYARIYFYYSYVYAGVPETLGRFVLGMWLLRAWQATPDAFLRHRDRIVRISALLGIAGGLAYMSRDLVRNLVDGLEYGMAIRTGRNLVAVIGTFGMAAFYAHLVHAALTNGVAQRATAVLADVGRMAFSNYLMQSACYLAIFTSLGLGLMGRFGTAVCIPIAMTIFGVQALASRWWLARFEMGPAEWAWRQLTYGRERQSPAPAVSAVLRG
jgi:uncharacterized protein